MFFINEIHRLSRAAQEVLYSVMEQGRLITTVRQAQRRIPTNIKLPPFTLVGCTTRLGLLNDALRDRFMQIFRLGYYSASEMLQMSHRSARLLGLDIADDALEEVAKRSRGTPREVNHILWFASKYQQVKRCTIDMASIGEIFEKLGIDAIGLNEMDMLLLETIIAKFDVGPVGLNTLAAALSEEPGTIRDAFEPYLFEERIPQNNSTGPHCY